MAWVAIGLGAAGAIAGGVSAISSNKGRAKAQKIQPYGGPRPPSVGDSFRPVQTMITDTLMRRSQGQDVGFDPKRREELGKLADYDYSLQGRDATNRLSGSGQSRNLAARDAILGRVSDSHNRYNMSLDVEDLTRRADERQRATTELGMLNAQNFGQENQVANFGLNEARFNAGAVTSNYDMENSYAQQYQNPWASALSGAAEGAGTGANIYSMIKKPQGISENIGDMSYGKQSGAGSVIGTTSGSGVRKGFAVNNRN
jgi:hypothetical protein